MLSLIIQLYGFCINSGGIVVGLVLALETGAALKSLAILLSKGVIICQLR